MTLIAPSVLSADFLNLEKDVRFINENADLFHLDIMDGTFVPNISFGFPVVEAIAKMAEKPLDVHLMIVHPEKYVKRFAQAGAAMISFHLEAMENDDDCVEILRTIRSCGAQAGLTINPDIAVERLYPYLQEVDFVLIMSVFAGFGGQKFIEAAYDKVKAVKSEIVSRGLNVKVEVDGGVSPANSAKLSACGADILVAGSSVFKADNPAAAVAVMRG